MLTRLLRVFAPFIRTNFRGTSHQVNSPRKLLKLNPNIHRTNKVLISAALASAGICACNEEQEEKRMSFRDQKIVEYENRIRTFSTPDKIFRYFATLRVGDCVYMAIDDFYRAITPGEIQPKNCGLDQFRNISLDRLGDLDNSKHVGSVLGDIFQKGILEFVDYLLITALISIPLWHVEVCFNMMDLDGNGLITVEEFRKMKDLVIRRSSIGNRHRDTSHGTHTSSRRGVSCVERYLFGESLDGGIKLEQFVAFLARLQKDLADHEFHRFSNVRISAVDFAETFSHYTHMSSAKRRSVLQRLRAHKDKLYVSYEDYSHFVDLLTRIDDLVLVLDFYDLADVTFDRESLRRLSRIVTGRELSPTMVEILFTVLDDNGDGHLSNHEFLSLLRKALSRGLDNPKDTQFLRTISIMYECATKA